MFGFNRNTLQSNALLFSLLVGLTAMVGFALALAFRQTDSSITEARQRLTTLSEAQAANLLTIAVGFTYLAQGEDELLDILPSQFEVVEEGLSLVSADSVANMARLAAARQAAKDLAKASNYARPPQIDMEEAPIYDSVLNVAALQYFVDGQLARIDPTTPAEELFLAEFLPPTRQIDDALGAAKEQARADLELQEESADQRALLQWFWPISIAFIALAAFFSFVLVRRQRRQLAGAVAQLQTVTVEFSKGEVPTIEDRNDELQQGVAPLRQLAENLVKLKEFAEDVGKGNFDSDASVFNNQGVLGKALQDMRNSLREVSEEERRRSWSNSALARFNDLVRAQGQNISQLGQSLTSLLAEQLQVQQVGIFVRHDDEAAEGDGLELVAWYAYDRHKYLTKTVAPGQGLVGQAYIEKKPQYLDQVPEGYLTISTGLGQASPRYLFVSPMVHNDEVMGVIELASLQPIDDYRREFLTELGEVLGSALSNARVAQRTEKLLSESQMMTEQMRAQEEEMRQNMEELQATQEEMERRNADNESQNKLMESILDNSGEAILVFTDSGEISSINHRATQLLEYSESELVGMNIASIMGANMSLGDLFDISYVDDYTDTTVMCQGGIESQVRMRVGRQQLKGKSAYAVFLQEMVSADSSKVAELEKALREAEQALAAAASQPGAKVDPQPTLEKLRQLRSRLKP